MTFWNDSGEIISSISALWPGCHTLLSEHLKQFANAYSISENDLKHETLLARNLIRKEYQLPTSLEQFISYIAPYKGAFGCLYKLLLKAVTLPVTSASCKRSFSKMKLVKTFIRNSMTIGRLSSNALLSTLKGYGLKNRFKWLRWWIWQSTWYEILM